MSTYRCQNCGHEFDAGLLFCGKCGAPNQTAQRIHQIEQMLQGEPAPPPGPPKPASAVYPPVPSPAEAVPPPPSPPSIVLQDMAAREPGKGPAEPAKPAIKNPKRLIKWIALAVAALLMVVGVTSLVRQVLLGYHASPERLFAGFRRALEEEDGELMLDLILPEQVEQYTFDESTVLDQIYIPDGELELLDVMEGKRGKSAYIFVIFQEEYTPSLSSYAAFGSYTLTLMVCKQDGKWYLNYTTSFFH